MGKTKLETQRKSEKIEGSSFSSKIPSAADLDDAKIGSRQAAGDKEKAIHMYEVYFCDDGSVYGDKFRGEMIALHLVHDYPNVFFLFIRALNGYCASRRTTQGTFPGTWQEACEDLKIKIVRTSPPSGEAKVQDEDGIGTFIKNRLAIYCDRTNLKNLCCFLDGFVHWRVHNPLEKGEPCLNRNAKIIIHVQEDSELNFGSEDEMECEIEVLKDMNATGVTAWQAHPPVWPPRFVLATVTFDSENMISLVFSGNTYPFAAGFDALDIGKKARIVEGSIYKEWYRSVRKIDVSIAEKRDWLLSIFGRSVLKNSPCVLNIEACPEENSNWKTLLTEIKQFTNVTVHT